MNDAPPLLPPLCLCNGLRLNASSLALAGLAVVPLLTCVLLRAAPRVLLQANGGLGFISELEQPLTIEPLPGALTLAAILAWLVLACSSRVLALWEPVLVLLGFGLALVRLGNVWCVGLLLLLPLAQQVSRLPLRRSWWCAMAAALLAANVLVVLQTRPASVPAAAVQTITQLAPSGARVYVYQPWAASLQAALGSQGSVVDAAPLESWPQTAVDTYQQVSLGGLGWEDELAQQDVSFVVLDPTSSQSWLIRALPQSPGWKVVLDSPACLVAELTPS